MKKLIVGLVILVMILIVIASTLFLSHSKDMKAVRSVANSNSNVYTVGTPKLNSYYHNADCRSLLSGYKVYYLDLETAFNMGLNPCPECDPPRPLLSKKEIRQAQHKRNEARIQEEKEREQAAIDYLKGIKNPKYIQSVEIVPANSANPSSIQVKDDNNDLNDLKRKVIDLYNSLLRFKDNSDFHSYGFGIGYRYNKWLKDVENLENVSRQKQLLFPEFSVGDLKGLGLEYIKTKGKENDYTRWVRKRIDNGLH